MYVGRIDGVITNDGTVLKVTDTSKLLNMVPTVDILVKKENGEYSADFTNRLSVLVNNEGDIQKEGTDLNLSGIYTKEYVEGSGNGFDGKWKIDEIRNNPEWVETSSRNIKEIDRKTLDKVFKFALTEIMRGNAINLQKRP
jgi:hypothetical protein